jgi:transposase
MAGRFEGLSDLEWKLFEDLFPEPEKRGKGMPHVPFRYVINTLLYILMSGCRWCDVPREQQWASKSSAHRWLKRWHQDGTLEILEQRILNLAQEKGLIRWDYGAIDGSFSPWKGWR